MPLVDTSFETRLAEVESRIQNAAAKSHRKRSDITLVAVSKKFSADHLLTAYHAGVRVFGENYVQEFNEKKPALGAVSGAQFHLIGHLQSNKSRVACELFDAIHTVDSVKLLQRIDAAAVELNKRIEVLVEVNLSGEQSKAGTTVKGLPLILESAEACRNVSVTGLMTMPPWSENAEESRPYFQQLAATAARFGLKQLSIGMSNDLETAIEEGSTMVRVGTALFGKRPKPAG